MTNNENIAISFCKSNELYKLMHYRSLCESIQKEIDKMLSPLRQRTLRGYYLSNKINAKLNNINKNLINNIENNSNMIKDVQSIQNEINTLYSKFKNNLSSKTVSGVDFDKEEDATLIKMFDGDMVVKDFLNIRMIYKNVSTQTEIPIALTQVYNTQVGYNNNRSRGNITASQRLANVLSDYLKVQEVQNYLLDIVQKAIEIRIAFKNSNSEDFLENHTNEEIKGWLDAKS